MIHFFPMAEIRFHTYFMHLCWIEICFSLKKNKKNLLTDKWSEESLKNSITCIITYRVFKMHQLSFPKVCAATSRFALVLKHTFSPSWSETVTCFSLCSCSRARQSELSSGQMWEERARSSWKDSRECVAKGEARYAAKKHRSLFLQEKKQPTLKSDR